jgi:hypothetical protein
VTVGDKKVISQVTVTNTKPGKKFPNALFGEPERIKKTEENPYLDSRMTMPEPGLKSGMIQENYVDTKQASTTKQTMNQALLKNKGMDQFALEPNEKIGICYDVRREGTSQSINSGSSVLGRFVVSNYRVRFIENGKRESPVENYYACSIPFGVILKVV